MKNRLNLLLMPLALGGFAVAQPVYNLLLGTPLFLLARQNTLVDVWALTAVLSLFGPLALALPAWLLWPRWPAFSARWCWILSGGFASLFIAQLLLASLGGHWLLFIGLSVTAGLLTSWLLLFTRWQVLTPVLAAIAIVFALWFLFFSAVSEQIETFAAVPLDSQASSKPSPDIVFVILDELPLATLLNNDGQIDKTLFPGFARLQSMSNWYYNTTSVSDGTVDAVPAILTGQYPKEEDLDPSVATYPINLFTVLSQWYQYNVSETVTRLCPQSLCPRSGPGMYARFKALLLDLSAIYLHRVTPDRWAAELPNVTANWSGFFAARQVFFPDGWVKFAGGQTVIDRPGLFRGFTDSIRKGDKPVLNFMHILFPHGPLAYFPSGENYGREWQRGQVKEHWGNVQWGIISGKQRHYLQTQYADRLLDTLLQRLQQQHMLEESLVVVVADHGVNFARNDTRRALSSSNTAAMLRVPLFIKLPGQTLGKRLDVPAMTVDILPTLLVALGVSSESLSFDGIDLESPEASSPRPRFVNSYLQRKLQVIDEASLDITQLVITNRTQLKLDSTSGALWQIGPYDEYRGQTMATICDRSVARIEVSFDGFPKLQNTDPAQAVRAYVAGSFSGDAVAQTSKPFLITSNGIIAASGYTWLFNDRWQFFALVEPSYVKQADWAPRAWLVEGRECLGPEA